MLFNKYVCKITITSIGYLNSVTGNVSNVNDFIISNFNNFEIRTEYISSIIMVVSLPVSLEPAITTLSIFIDLVVL
ncbi:hypothetical protein [uncultured Methanobrevibacter sp.]|uniref:hypothetical protein n=1 Tax=uncultured Methanobrevibacter sp. TaxID=253161 RepID=UPI0025F6211A|nr:hypothetical protein [uncultured Methanobrevibacter sp.]